MEWGRGAIHTTTITDLIPFEV